MTYVDTTASPLQDRGFLSTMFRVEATQSGRMPGVTSDVAQEAFNGSHIWAGRAEGKPKATDRKQAFKRRFERLARKWRNDTIFLSSLQEKFLHPAYQQIIGMGPEAIPYILRELKKRPAYWFWAIDSISGEHPLAADFDGDFDASVAAYIKWGARKGV